MISADGLQEAGEMGYVIVVYPKPKFFDPGGVPAAGVFLCGVSGSAHLCAFARASWPWSQAHRGLRGRRAFRCLELLPLVTLDAFDRYEPLAAIGERLIRPVVHARVERRKTDAREARGLFRPQRENIDNEGGIVRHGRTSEQAASGGG